MKLAIIRTGNKQYKVKEGDKIKVEKLEGEANTSIVLDDVLLFSENDNVELGTPKLDKKVEAKIVRQGRSAKVVGANYKNKTRHFKSFGHRQHFTELEIVKL